MKFPVDFALFATLAALGSAASISASPHDANRPLIATADDIPDLPEGFTWEIVKQPRGNDTSVKTTVSNTDLQPEGLPERAMGISCQGVSTKQQNPVLIVSSGAYTDRNTAPSKTPFVGRLSCTTNYDSKLRVYRPGAPRLVPPIRLRELLGLCLCRQVPPSGSGHNHMGSDSRCHYDPLRWVWRVWNRK